MHRLEKTGETWNLYGKEITPVMNVYGKGTGQRSKTGSFGYAWAYLRPVRFVVKEGGEEQRIDIPAVDRIFLLMLLWMVMLPFLVYFGKKLFGAR